MEKIKPKKLVQFTFEYLNTIGEIKRKFVTGTDYKEESKKFKKWCEKNKFDAII